MDSTRISPIRDSKGASLKVPKNLMDTSGLKDEIQIEAKKGKIILQFKRIVKDEIKKSHL